MSAPALARKSEGKKGEPPSIEMAIQKLRETEEMLSRKSEYLEKKVEEQVVLAKKHGLEDKRAALNALKRKKRLDKELQQIKGTLSTIEFQREALEKAQMNTEVLKNMQFAAEALKATHQQLNVDDVYKTMDDVTEQNELGQEISNAQSAPSSMNQQDIDEDDLLAELIEKLEQVELDTRLLDVKTTVPELPEVPSGPVKEKTPKPITE